MTDEPKKVVALPGDDELDAEHPGLTKGQVRRAKERARKTVEAARVKALLEKIEEKETERLAREEGLQENAEPMVSVTLNLVPPMPYIAIDGRRYVDHKTYAVRESVARELLFTMYKGWEQESARTGQDKYAFYASRVNSATPAFTINARTGAVTDVVVGGMPQGRS